MIRRLEIPLLVLILALSLAAAFWIGSSAATGLTGQFWSNQDWSGQPASVQSRSLPNLAHFQRGVPRAVATGGSAEWQGVLFADHSGEYEFEVSTDNRAWLYVGGSRVIEYGDDQTQKTVRGRLMLDAGAHPVRIRYVQHPGVASLDVFWSGPGIERHLLREDELAPGMALPVSASRRSMVRAAAVAVPVIWALLLIYVPARLASSWLWREVEQVAPAAGDRRSLTLVLVTAAGLVVWGLTWGLDSSWAPDELDPAQVRELIDRRFGDGWYDKYPVMHYAVVGVPVSAFEIASSIGLLPADSPPSRMAQLAAMRLVSAVMALGTLIVTFLCAAELYGPKRAALASWSLLLTGLFVFYGKVANLDVPFMCWFALAMLGFIRIWTRNRTVDFVLLGIAAAAAVATKDQAYASLALLPIGVVAANVRVSAPSPLWRRFVAALVNPRMLLGGLVSALTFAICHNAIFNFRGVVEHFRLLSTLGDLATVARTVEGYVSLTRLTAELYRFALGWPLALAALAGIGTAAWRPERRWWLWLLLVPLSFHLMFTFVTLYVNDRYLFGGLFVAALFAGSILADALDRIPSRLAGRAVVAAVLGASFLSAASVNAMMQVDARKDARAWVEAHARDADRIGLIGWYMPAFGPGLRPLSLPATREAVNAARPEWLVLNRRFAARFESERSPLGRDLLAGFADGSLGYTEQFRLRGALPPWAILQYEPEFQRPRESTWTNLDKINPEMVVYRRR